MAECLDCFMVLLCSECDAEAGTCDCNCDWYCPICDKED